MKPRTSLLWNYFKIKDEKKKIAKCNRCGQCLNYRATVTNLKKHYERRHKDVTLPCYKKIKTEKNEDGDIHMVYDIDDSQSPSSSLALVPSESQENQVKVTTAPSESQCSVSSKTHSENNSENELGLPSNNSMDSLLLPSKELNESQKLDKLLLQLFIQHYHPVSIVEDEAFINFVNGLNLSYKLPSKKTVTNTMIPAEYDKCLYATRRELQAVKSACLSIDIWNSENPNSYMDVTAHYITETFELRSVLLECLLLPVSPRSADLAELIQCVAQNFKLCDKLSVLVSDSACDINDEVTKELKVEHFSCFAHTLNLILQDALKTAKELTDKIRNIVGYFKRNCSSSQKLNLAQKMTFDLEPKKLIQEDSTRWNSTFYMIQRFSELQDAIKTTIASVNEDLPILTEDEWTACKELSTVLEPFEEVTEEICEEQYITGSLIIPLTNGLRRHPFITLPSYKKIKKETKEDGVIHMVCDIDDPQFPSSSLALAPSESLENQVKVTMAPSESQCSVSSKTHSENNSENELGLPSNNSMDSLLLPSKELNESQKLDKLLLQLFIQHYHPVSIVEDEAFINFVNGLNLSYKLPSKKTVTNTMIPAEYDKCLHAARRELQAVKSVCLSIDIWKSENLNSYMDVAAHYITETFELRSILLECLLLPVSPSSADLAELIQCVAQNSKISDKLSVIISDNSSNINDEVTKELKVEHFSCFAHTLNLILQDALKTANELTDKIKNIVAYFKRNSSSCQKLNLAQKMTFDLEPKKFVEEDSTRWNSTFYMIQRFSELQDAIKTTITSINEDLPILTEDEWTACKQLSTVLEPIEEVTEEICEEQYITGSLIIPLTNGLRSVCDIMQEEEFGSIAKCVIDEILKGINIRMCNIEDNKSLALATFLDPRFKLAPFSNEFSAQSIKKHCTSLIADIWTQKQQSKASTDQTNDDCNQSDTSNISSVGRLVKFSVWDKLDKTIASKKSTGAMSAALIEVNRYIEDTFLGRKEDPLLWWKKNQYYYPLMTKLVITKFNVVGTSLPCERLFTKAGNVITERRSRLRTKNIEKLLFLNANSFLIN